MRRIVLLLVLSFQCAWGLAARAGEIGLYADRTCTGCEITIPPLGATDTLFVCILNDGDPPVYCGQPLYGAAFRIEGLPLGWVIEEARPTPEACFVYGEPFGPQGVSVDLCFDGASSDRCIPLYTLVLAPLAVHSDIHLRVVGGLPCYVYGDCPMIYTGDKPCDPTCQCYPGGEIVVNPVNDHCTVGIESRTWSRVRALYGLQ